MINYERNVEDEKAATQRLQRAASDLVEQRERAAAAVAEAEALLMKQSALLMKIEREDLPELLRSAGLLEITTDKGVKVELKEEISCGISAERREAAHAALHAAGLSGVIKTLLTVEFGKEELEKAEAMFLQLSPLRPEGTVSLAESVHPATLKSLLKERRAAGKLTADEQALFAVIPYTIAKCKKAKKG